MKKSYKKPVVKLSAMELEDLICLSLQQGDANPNNPVLGREGNLNEGSFYQSKSVWDDDDEE